MNLRGQKIFVTGASGFIGGRLVEKLLIEEGAEVVALVRKFKNASRLARFPIKMVAGDVLDADGLAKAMGGCVFAVHCAMDASGTPEQNNRVTIDGTRNVCVAAQKAKVKRLVHLSTISVYGRTPTGPMNESTAKNPKHDAYGTSKLEAEGTVLDFSKAGLPYTVLQPTVVFGPWAYWTTSIATQLGSGTVVLPDDGEGFCNAVYVDDVVNAICCALRIDRPIPGPYLISAEFPVTWADYYHAYAKWIPGSAIGGEPAAAMERRLARQKFIGTIAPTLFPQTVRFKISRGLQNFPALWQAYNSARGRCWSSNDADLPQSAFPIIIPDPQHRVYPRPEIVRFMTMRSSVSIRRAQDELGFKPRFDLNKAMEILGPWLQWAGFAPR